MVDFQLSSGLQIVIAQCEFWQYQFSKLDNMTPNFNKTLVYYYLLHTFESNKHHTTNEHLTSV